MIYSGIGSRKTPNNILFQMAKLAKDLDNSGFILRSGGARGADTAFASAARTKIICLPHRTLQGNTYLNDALSSVCNYDITNLPEYTRLLLLRNMQIVLGPSIYAEKSAFVVCWTPNGDFVGGTKYGIKIAQLHKIPVYNYATMSDKDIRNSIL